MPVLVCLTFADRLYTEIMHTNSGHKLPELLDREINVCYHLFALYLCICLILQSKRRTLMLPDKWKVWFCSFNQEADSDLNNKEGRQRLRDVGICSASEIRDWLMDTFNMLGQDDMSQRLRKYFKDPQGLLK